MMNLIHQKPYFSYYLHQKPIYIYGYENDAELAYLFELENIQANTIILDHHENEKCIYEFETIEDEVQDTIQSILSLYEKGISLSHILS